MVQLPNFEGWNDVRGNQTPKKSVQLPSVTGWADVPVQNERPKTSIQLPNDSGWNDVPAHGEPQKSVQMADPGWDDLPGVQPPQTVAMFQGVNRLDPFSIQDTYATDELNLSTSAFPAAAVRPGHSQLGTSFTGVTGLMVWQDKELHVIANGVWSKWTGSTWTQLATGLSTTAVWSSANFKGNLADQNLIVANGVDTVRRYDGTSVSTLTGAPAGGNYIVQHDNRMYCAVSNTVHYSALRKADDWTTAKDAGQIVIEDPTGEKINALVAGAGHVVIFFPSAVYELWGTGPRDYRVQPVAEDIGIMNNKCWANLNGLLYFLDDNGVYEYGGGVRPSRKFSLPVQKYIEGINPAQKSRCCVGTDGQKLYVSIPYQGSTTNNVTLVYDPQFSVWNVWGTITPDFYEMMGNTLHHADSIGRVGKQGGVQDFGSPVSWRWVSKPFGGDSRSQLLRWYRLWCVTNIAAGNTGTVSLSPSASGGSDWTAVQFIPTGSVAKSTKTMIPVASIAQATWIRVKVEGSGPATLYELARQQRAVPLG